MHRRIKRFPSPLSSPSPQSFPQRHESLHRSGWWRGSVPQPATRQRFGVVVPNRVRAEQRQRALQLLEFLGRHRLRRKLRPPCHTQILAYSPYVRLLPETRGLPHSDTPEAVHSGNAVKDIHGLKTHTVPDAHVFLDLEKWTLTLLK